MHLVAKKKDGAFSEHAAFFAREVNTKNYTQWGMTNRRLARALLFLFLYQTETLVCEILAVSMLLCKTFAFLNNKYGKAKSKRDLNVLGFVLRWITKCVWALRVTTERDRHLCP